MHSNDSKSGNNDTKQAHSELADDPSFFDKPKNISIIMYSFYALCIILVALDFVVHRHIYLSFDKIPAFYAIYGFIACVVLVVIAKLMRHVVMRDEHYYDDRIDEREDEKEDKQIASTVNNKTQQDALAQSSTGHGDKPL